MKKNTRTISRYYYTETYDTSYRGWVSITSTSATRKRLAVRLAKRAEKMYGKVRLVKASYEVVPIR